VILWCNYEEMQAVRFGAEAVLSSEPESTCAVAAPPAVREDLEQLLATLEGDLGVATLQDQRNLRRGLEAVVECLQAEMRSDVVHAHPAHEAAVAAYFYYAHAVVVLGRVVELGEEMEALLEVLTGREATPELAASFQFPD